MFHVKPSSGISNMMHFNNFHTHTARCRHAEGTEREFIESALAAGMTTIGFSDHSPYYFPDGYYSDYRMYPEEQKEYFDTLTALKKEYADRIEILIGYETEYYPLYFGQFLKMIAPFPVDYLILGLHYLNNEIGRIRTFRPTDRPEHLTEYVDTVCDGIRTGIFSYLAHPDLLWFNGDEAFRKKEYIRLIACAVEHHLPLEINLHGLALGRTYPDEAFFALAGEMGGVVCIGSDAHAPDQIYPEEAVRKCEELIEKYHLSVDPRPLKLLR